MNVQRGTPRIEGTTSVHGSMAKDAASDERSLVAEAKSGRSSAFAELYERHRLKVYHTVLRILRNRQDAEDAGQRSFQRAFTNLDRFREDSTFSTWVTRIAINEALMLLRQRRTTAWVSEVNDDQAASTLDLADEGRNPEQILADNELRAAVTQAISRLRGSLRAVVLLRELHGYTNAETARRLGLTVSTVKARVFHARRHLRKHFARKYRGACRDFLIAT